MLNNYLKIAIKVLLRRKFFTFISLFGISFTLIVLMVFTSLIDHSFKPGGPEQKSGRILGIHNLTMKSPDRHSTWSSGCGYRFLDRYVRTLQTPEKIAVYQEISNANSFLNGQKISLELKRTDGVYWEILDHEFIEGRPISSEDEESAHPVAVINESVRAQLFGYQSALGKAIHMDGQRLEVIGVVRDVSYLQTSAFAEVWAPISTLKTTAYREALIDDFEALLLARSPRDFSKIKAEFQSVLLQVEFPDPKEYNYIIGGADSKFEAFARDLYDEYDQPSASSHKLLATMLGLMLLFMLLPTLNLVNINLSRIMERASEIGLRKAFGASSITLVFQFVVENLLLTLIGGLIGFAGAVVVLSTISSSGLIPYATFELNARLFFYGLGLILFFGILSGVLPAWKMSRLHPVDALKGRIA